MIGTYRDEKMRPLNVRLVPDKSGKLADVKIEANAEFPVHAVELGWCKVDGGWCDARFVTVRDGGMTPTQEEAPAGPAEGHADAAPAIDGGDLELMTVAELKEHADANGIEYKAKATKQELIEAIAGDE